MKKLCFMTTYFGQVMAKKNNWKPQINRRTGRLSIIPTAAFKAQEKDMVATFAEDFDLQSLRLVEFAGKELAVGVQIWNKDLRKHDIDNQLSTIMDALTKAHVIPDDNQKTIVRATIEYMGIDKDDPRAEITIYPLE